MGLIIPDLQVRFLPPPLCGSFSGKTPGRDPGITGSIPVPQSSGFGVMVAQQTSTLLVGVRAPYTALKPY